MAQSMRVKHIIVETYGKKEFTLMNHGHRKEYRLSRPGPTQVLIELTENLFENTIL